MIGKRKHESSSSSAYPPMSRPRVDDDERKFLRLMGKIEKKAENEGKYAYIYTDQKNSLDFKAKIDDPPGDRATNLRKEQSNSWKFIPNRSNSQIMLLIPPHMYDSTDISDFAQKYNETAWKELFQEIRKRLSSSNKNYWVYTHGGGEDILHIRFEPGPKRKYDLSQLRNMQ